VQIYDRPVVDLQEMFELFLEKKTKDEEQQRLKRRWQEEKNREDAKRLKEQQQEKEKEEKSRRIEEQRKQLKELEHAESPEDAEMKGEPDDDYAQDEEHEEENWEDDQNQPEPWKWEGPRRKRSVIQRIIVHFCGFHQRFAERQKLDHTRKSCSRCKSEA
jgi:hypothetical protein